VTEYSAEIQKDRTVTGQWLDCTEAMEQPTDSIQPVIIAVTIEAVNADECGE